MKALLPFLKRTASLLTVMLFFAFAQNASAQTAASATWNPYSSSSATVTPTIVGNITAANLSAANASLGSGITTSGVSYYNNSTYGIGGEGWSTSGSAPSATSSSYIQFQVGPSGSNNLTVTGLTFKGLANDYQDGLVIYYSTSSSFSSPTTLYNNSNLNNSSGSSFTYTSGTLNISVTSGTTLYFRVMFYAVSHSNNIIGIVSNLVVNGTTVSTTPTLTAGSLTAFGNVCLGSVGGPNSFTLTGSNLTGIVTVNALTGYTYSTTSNGTYNSTLTLTPTSGSLSSTVYVDLSPAAAQSYSGSISITGGGATATSVSASGTGVAVPTISSEPSTTAQTLCQSSAATALSVIASVGSGTISYQWYSNSAANNTSGSIISGATSSSYTPSTSVAGTTYYYCVVSNSNSCPVASTVSGGVTVYANTSISSQPSGATVCQGVSASLSVTAAGGNGTYSYQWYSNSSSSTSGSTLLTGATNSTYSPNVSSSATTYYYVIVTGSCGTAVTSSIVKVVVNSLPTATFTTSPSSNICANTSVTYTTQSGQSSYSWSVPGTSGTDYSITSGGTGSTSSTVTLTWKTSGSKTVTVNYANSSGCTSSSAASNNITVYALPTATFTTSPSSNICPGTSVTYTTQSGQLSYSWSVPGNAGTDYSITGGGISSSSNTVTLTWMTAGSKTVTVNYNNSNGCSSTSAATSTITVYANTSISSQPSGSTICQGNSPSLSVTAAGGNGSYTYQWYSNTTNSNSNGTSVGSSNGGQTASYSPTMNTAGTFYYYVVVSGSCGSSVSSSVAQVVVNPTTNITSQPSNVTVCQNGSASLSVSATGTGLTYQWYVYTSFYGFYFYWNPINGANSPNYSPSTSTSGTNYYEVVVTGSCGSQTSNFVTVTVNAAATISGTLSACAGGTSQLTGSGTAASSNPWTSSNTAVATVSTGGKVSALVVGTTTITYTNNSGCSVSSTFTVNPLPSTPTLSGSSSVCATYTTQLTASASGGTWSSSNTSVATVNSSGVVTGVTGGSATIYYSVTNSSGCSATGSQSFTVNPLPTVQSITGSSSVCVNANIALSDATTGGSWSSSNTGLATINSSGVVTGVASGTVTITYTYSNGTCSNSVTKSVTINALPTVASISGSSSMSAGTTTTFTDGTSGGSWSSGNTSVASVNSSGAVTALNTGSATIYYTVTNSNGCSSSASLNVTITGFVSSATDYFKSTASGDWSISSDWQGSHDNVNYYGATSIPTSSAAAITISSGNQITISTSGITAANLVVSSGGQLNVSNGFTMHHNSGVTYDLNIQSGGLLVLNGENTVTDDGSSTLNLNSGATLQIGSASGITSSGANGNIQTNSRIFNAGANYVYNGSSAQSTGNGLPTSLTGSLTINNTAGITLSQATGLNNVLYLASGLLTTSASNLLSLGGSASVNLSVSDYTNTSYVNGPIQKTGNTAFTFPVGKSNGYEPIGISATSDGSSQTFTAEYFRASAFTVGTNLAPGTLLQNISSCDYYRLDLGSTYPSNTNSSLPNNATVNVTMYWNQNNPCDGLTYVNDPTTLNLAHYSYTNGWDEAVYSAPPGSPSGNSTNGSFTIVGVSVFSPFALGSTSGNNPLPILMDYFTAVKEVGYNKLTWKAECSQSTSGFVVERSYDGNTYSAIDSMNINSSSDCSAPFVYNDNSSNGAAKVYYRIKMVDINGNSYYSNIEMILNSANALQLIGVQPNPVVGDASLKIAASADQNVELVIMSVDGKQIERKSIEVQEGTSLISLNTGMLAKGMYFVKAVFGNGQISTVKFIKQ